MVPPTRVSSLQSHHTKSPGIFHCLPGVHWDVSDPCFLHLLTGPLKKVQSFSKQAVCSLLAPIAHSWFRVRPRCLVQSQKPSPGAGHHLLCKQWWPQGTYMEERDGHKREVWIAQQQHPTLLLMVHERSRAQLVWWKILSRVGNGNGTVSNYNSNSALKGKVRFVIFLIFPLSFLFAFEHSPGKQTHS